MCLNFKNVTQCPRCHEPRDAKLPGQSSTISIKCKNLKETINHLFVRKLSGKLKSKIHIFKQTLEQTVEKPLKRN